LLRRFARNGLLLATLDELLEGAGADRLLAVAGMA
jgi:hypothetical protein